MVALRMFDGLINASVVFVLVLLLLLLLLLSM